MSAEQTQMSEGQEPEGTEQDAPIVANPGNELKDIADLLDFGSQQEPQKEETPTGDPKEGEPDGGAEEPKIAPAPKPGEEGPKPEEKKEPEGDKALKELLAEVIKEAKGAGQVPEQKAPAEEEYKPKYNPQLPDTIFQAMESDDPQLRRQGIQAMIGGAMNKVYEDVRKEMQGSLAQVLQQVPQVLSQQQSLAAQQEQMRQDFYSTYPEFGQNEAQKRLVATVAMQLAQKKGQAYKGYTKEFRDELGTTLRELTGIQPKAKEPAKPAVPAKPKPGQAAFTNGGTRPASSGTPTLADEILSTVRLN